MSDNASPLGPTQLQGQGQGWANLLVWCWLFVVQEAFTLSSMLDNTMHFLSTTGSVWFFKHKLYKTTQRKKKAKKKNTHISESHAALFWVWSCVWSCVLCGNVNLSTISNTQDCLFLFINLPCKQKNKKNKKKKQKKHRNHQVRHQSCVFVGVVLCAKLLLFANFINYLGKTKTGWARHNIQIKLYIFGNYLVLF